MSAAPLRRRASRASTIRLPTYSARSQQRPASQRAAETMDWAGWALFGLVATAILMIVMMAAQLAGHGAFLPADIRVGQAMADVATISLLHERSMSHSDTLNEQLQ